MNLRDFVVLVFRLAQEGVWVAIGYIFDKWGDTNLIDGLMAIVFIGMVIGISAWRMQKSLNQRITSQPAEKVKIWQLELRYSIFGILALPFRFAWWMYQKVKSGFSALFSRASKSAGGAAISDAEQSLEFEKEGGGAEDVSGREGEPDVVPGQDDAESFEEDVAVTVATVGPSLLLATMFSAAVFVVAFVLEPVLSSQMQLSRGVNAWEFIIFGTRPEMGSHLPLQSRPYFAGALVACAWLLVTWEVSRVFRLAFAGSIGSNLAANREERATLPWWREWFGAEYLFEPSMPWREWGRWIPIAATPLLVLAWVQLGGETLRLAPGWFSVSLIATFSWSLHLLLKGVDQPGSPEQQKLARRAIPEAANGWQDVVEFLIRNHRLQRPDSDRPPRAVESLDLSALPGGQQVVTPLLAELLPESHELTNMQFRVLRTLSAGSYDYVEPANFSDSLSLGEELSDVSPHAEHANQVILAPEGSGKSTLALLAACNHVLVHAQSTLIVTRHRAHGERLTRMLQERISPSTLRWNLRVRRVGGDVIDDMAVGIVPDIVVADLDQLVTVILDNPRSWQSFFEQVGLIVVDDVEEFCGAEEAHAQLAFRRLTWRIRELHGARQLGDDSSAQVLVLGAESMSDMGRWAQSLCGIEASIHRFSATLAGIRRRERAEMAAQGLAIEPTNEGDGEPKSPEREGDGVERFQKFFRIGDFLSSDGNPLAFQKIIQACEELAVPWIVRSCGDYERALDAGALSIDDEPRHRVADAMQACVVFLRGSWAEIQRERARVTRAGARFNRHKHADDPPPGREEIAIIELVDRDEVMAFTELDESSSIATILDTLPRPVIRVPDGWMRDAHMSADLTRSWIETADVIDVFGSRSARTLERLAKARMLSTEERKDIREGGTEFETQLWIRALARAVDAGLGEDAVLPHPVRNVHVSSMNAVEIRDRTSMTPLLSVDPFAAAFAYYPGRIFDAPAGKYIVAARHLNEDVGGFIEVEPYLSQELSSPRRRCDIHIRNAEIGGGKPEPMIVGEAAITVGVVEIVLRMTHIATIRLDPSGVEVRQRHLMPRNQRSVIGAKGLSTEALVIYPNPGTGQETSSAPALSLKTARLIAAVMRAVLPSLYRGARHNIDLSLYVGGEAPGNDDVLKPDDGFFFYDLQREGNGTARSLFRDGVEPLLRLTRLFLERILYHDRVVTLHDHWGDENELLVATDRASVDAANRRLADETVRHDALAWLDSRLTPEISSNDSRAGHYGTGFEKGEGDVADLGRCWFTDTGKVTNLIWSKHRWTDGADAYMVDIGIDRVVARYFGAFLGTAKALKQRITRYQTELAEVYSAPDADAVLRPTPVFKIRGRSQPEFISSHANPDEARELHGALIALAEESGPILRPLADTLREATSAQFESNISGRYAFVRFASRMIQSLLTDERAESGSCLSPTTVLLRRRGDAVSKSLTLAVLLSESGFDAGVIFSPSRNTAYAAVSLMNNSIGQRVGLEAGSKLFQGDAAGAPGLQIVNGWRTALDIEQLDVSWSVAVAGSDFDSGDSRAYLAVSVVRELEPGQLDEGDKNDWMFLPLGRTGGEAAGRDGGSDSRVKTGAFTAASMPERATLMPEKRTNESSAAEVMSPHSIDELDRQLDEAERFASEWDDGEITEEDR